MNIIRSILEKFFNTPVEKQYLIIASFFGFLLLVFSPPMAVVDEDNHFFRAYEVSQGNFITDKINHKSYGAQVPKNVSDFIYTNKQKAFQNPLKKQGDEHKILLESDFSSEVPNWDHKVEVLYNASAAYSPIPYIPQAIGMKVAELFNAPIGIYLLLGRLMNFITFTTVVYFSIRYINRGGYILFAVALLPMTIFQSVSLSADVITIAAMFILATLLVNIFTDRRNVEAFDTKRTFFLIAALVVLLMGKVVYIPMVVGSLALTVVITRYRNRNFKQVGQELMPLLFGAMVSVVLYVIWSNLNSGAITESQALFFDNTVHVSVRDQIVYILTNPLIFGLKLLYNVFFIFDTAVYSGMIGRFGYADWQVLLPVWSVVLGYVGLGMSVLLQYKPQSVVSKTNRLVAVMIMALAVITFFGIYVLMYLIFTPVGNLVINGVQGRYFIPVALFILLAFMILNKAGSSRALKTSRFVFMGIVIINLTAMMIVIFGYYR